MWHKIRSLFSKEPGPNFKDMLAEGASLLDVRTDKEFQEDHLNQAIHIPLDELDQRLTEVKSIKQPVIAYCRSGRRSGIATKKLKAQGILTYNGGGLKELRSIIN